MGQFSKENINAVAKEMKKQQITDPQFISFNFGILSQLIAERNQLEGFNTNTITRYDVSCDEFMLMEESEKELAFKHSNTRNYVFLQRENKSMPWKLIVPQSKTPFKRGTFDK